MKNSNKMTKILIFSIFMVIMLHSPEGYTQSTFPAMVTRIIDGDSIVVKTGKEYLEVRLYGIDAPEWQQSFSSMARNYLKEHILKERVIIIPQYYDSYGRLVALLVHDGKSVNGKLVEDGMAWVYPHYCRKKICKKWRKGQQRAEKNGRGLWQNKDPVSPWRWKSERLVN